MFYYKNVSNTIKTFYGVTFQPQQTAGVAKYINDAKMIRVPAPKIEPKKVVVKEGKKKVEPVKEEKKTTPVKETKPSVKDTKAVKEDKPIQKEEK